MEALGKEANMLPDIVPNIVIPVSAVLAIAFGLWLWKRVSAITMVPGAPNRGSVCSFECPVGALEGC